MDGWVHRISTNRALEQLMDASGHQSNSNRAMGLGGILMGKSMLLGVRNYLFVFISIY